MKPNPHEFEFAIICALPREFNAVDALFDERYTDLGTKRHHGDSNFYQTGRMGTCDVVLACLPEMGKASAASAASSLCASFTNITLTLVVGVCGGVPFPTSGTELILGDVIVSHEIVKFDFGRQYPDRFERKGGVLNTLDRSNRDVLSLLSGLRTHRMRDRFQAMYGKHLQMLQKDSLWEYPGVKGDKLYPPSCHHVATRHPGLTDDCDTVGCSGEPIIRERLNGGDNPQPCVYIGRIASGDTVVKSAEHRDDLAYKEQIIGFEMEGAGVCEALSSLVIKGVCDYADSHKNKDWQDYAAASAASCAKAFLDCLVQIKYQQCGIYAYSKVFQSSPENISPTITTQLSRTWGVSATSNACEIDDRVWTANEALRTFSQDIPSAAMRGTLISAGESVIQTTRSKMIKGNKVLQSKCCETLFGTIYFRSQVLTRRILIADETVSQTEAKTSIIFHPARWVLRLGIKYGFNAMASNYLGSWRYAIRPVHVVPDNALIFDFCESGNVEAVQRLFERGEASVFDNTRVGFSPLHVGFAEDVAVAGGQFEMAKFLIANGADKMAHAQFQSITKPWTPPQFLQMTEPPGQRPRLLSLFGDCIEFYDSQSNGWQLLLDTTKNSSSQSLLHWYSALLQIYRAEGSSTINYRRINSCLCKAANKNQLDVMKLLLDFVPRGGYPDLVSKLWLAPILIKSWAKFFTLLQLLVDRGVDLQTILRGETPISQSLRFFATFSEWRCHVTTNHSDIDTLLVQELAQAHVPSLRGWGFDTLRDLCLLKITTKSKELRRFPWKVAVPPCTICQKVWGIYEIHGGQLVLEPWWEGVKYSVKYHECLCRVRKWVEDTRKRGEIKHTCGEEAGTQWEDDLTNMNTGYQKSPTRLGFGVQRILRQDIHTTALGASGAPSGCQNPSNSQPRESRGNLDLDARYDVYKDHATSPDRPYPTDKSDIAFFAMLTEYYHRKYGGWREKYEQGEYYCFACLAAREDWDLEPMHKEAVSDVYSVSIYVSDAASLECDIEEYSASDQGSDSTDDLASDQETEDPMGVD